MQIRKKRKICFVICGKTQTDVKEGDSVSLVRPEARIVNFCRPVDSIYLLTALILF